MNRRYLYIGILVLVLFWLSPAIAEAQCSICNAAASTSTEETKDRALALNTGILFLMVIPYFFLTAILLIWLKFRREKRQEQGV